MSKKEEDIERRHSTADLEAMKAAGRRQTDWLAAAEKLVPDGSDSDDAMEQVEWATTEPPMPKPH